MKTIAMLLACSIPLAHAGTAGDFKIPITVIEDPCLLTTPTVTNSDIKVSELKTGHKGEVELSFSGCTAGETVDIQATATSDNSSAIDVFLAKDTVDQGTSINNTVTLAGLNIEASGTTTSKLYYNIKAVDKTKPSALVGKSNVNIALTYTYQ
ncbi:hypothetical protein QBK15_004576 [Salmonella enterica]|nr:hypothetical protein [Salmonella enterica]